MAIQKKHGKGRLDKWYRLAKEKGYRARAAFKLIQLNRKYGFLEKSKVLLDLCAAPGSWCQVAAETMPAGSIILGVDLSPIKPIPKTITFQSDITTDKCRAVIRSHLKTWKADTVLHDGAPNVGVAWVQDAYSQAELVLQSLKLATEFLTPGGTFVTKVFRSDSYNPLLWVFQELFEKVEATKPPSSRNVSAEIFVVCRGFKAPKRIDPKFLDTESVFKQVVGAKENHEVKVYKPEKKTRKREGYEEGDYTQFKDLPASEFVTTSDPIDLLGTVNEFHFRDAASEAGNTIQQVLDKLEETTNEIRECCKDLKVLGRKDFKKLLQWRIRAREILGLSKAKITEPEQEEETAIVDLDPEMQMQKDLEALKDAATARKKRDRRRENERKRKEIVRMQMNMQTPMDIGVEHSNAGMGSGVFSLKAADSAEAFGQLAKGRMPIPATRQKSPTPDNMPDSSSDEDGDRLETQLDEEYEVYLRRREEISSKERAKRARQEFEREEWDGFGDDNEHDLTVESGSDSESSLNENSDYEAIHSESRRKGSLTKDAQAFFSQDIFRDIDGLDLVEDSDSGIEIDDASPLSLEKNKDNSGDDTARENIQMTPKVSDDHNEYSTDEEPAVDAAGMHGADEKYHTPMNIEIITAEAMELARQIASGKKKSSDLVDDGFNKLAFRDREGLPQWFLDDETRSNKYQKPITAAAAAAIKEKLRLLNARPIKKVREAKARKQMRATRRLEKLRKKSALIADDEGVSEKDKAASIMKMMSRAGKKKPERKTQLVVAKGVNRGVSGRPRGVKGRYKVVDARLKKDARALKRLAKKKKTKSR